MRRTRRVESVAVAAAADCSSLLHLAYHRIKTLIIGGTSTEMDQKRRERERGRGEGVELGDGGGRGADRGVGGEGFEPAMDVDL